MGSTGYIALTRQSGLLREMQVVAHNIANISTTGYRREGVVFSEHMKRLDAGDAPLSMAAARGRTISGQQGTLTQTGGRLDFAIEGDGFFLVETPEGERLTRAGNFTSDEAGQVVTTQGHLLLDEGGAGIFLPPDARAVMLAPDGTLSADGRPLARIAIVRPLDVPAGIQREAGTLFRAEGGVEPAPDATLVQGFLEESNVAAVSEIARMIEVQRAYELGQKLLDREDERIRSVIRTLGS